MKVIIIGDVVGKPGRRRCRASLKRLKDQHEAEFVVANAENAAEGAGIIPRVGDEILNAGVDVMTSGNHIYDKKEGIQVHRKRAAIASTRQLRFRRAGSRRVVRVNRIGHARRRNQSFKAVSLCRRPNARSKRRTGSSRR